MTKQNSALDFLCYLVDNPTLSFYIHDGVSDKTILDYQGDLEKLAQEGYYETFFLLLYMGREYMLVDNVIRDITKEVLRKIFEEKSISAITGDIMSRIKQAYEEQRAEEIMNKYDKDIFLS